MISNKNYIDKNRLGFNFESEKILYKIAKWLDVDQSYYKKNKLTKSGIDVALSRLRCVLLSANIKSRKIAFGDLVINGIGFAKNTELRRVGIPLSIEEDAFSVTMICDGKEQKLSFINKDCINGKKRIAIGDNNELVYFDIFDDLATKSMVQISNDDGIKVITLNNNIYSCLGYEVMFKNGNPVQKIKLTIDYPSEHEIDSHTNLDISSDKLIEFFKSISFPIDLNKVCSSLNQLVGFDATNYPSINLVTANYIKRQLDEMYNLTFTDGKLADLTVTKNGKYVSVQDFTNWAYKSNNVTISNNDGDVTYSVDNENIDNVFNPTSNFEEAVETIEKVRTLTKSLLPKKNN